MKIVIDIDEEYYNDIKENDSANNYSVLYALDAIRNSTPLPKGYGRLIDADSICKDIISALGIRNENYLLEAEEAVYRRIKNAPTIIEADGGGEE